MKVQNATKLIRILQEFQRLNKNMNIPMALTMLEVGKGKGSTGRDIEAATRVSSSVASRNLMRLEKIAADGKAGWDLVDVVKDQDGKSSVRYPNDEMKKFLSTIEYILEGE